MSMKPSASGLDWRKSSYSDNQGGNCVEVALTWAKSSYSSSQGGNCVEVAQGWHKSSHSSNQGGNCVEVASEHCHTHLRDSKNPGHGYFSFSTPEWARFLSTAVPR